MKRKRNRMLFVLSLVLLLTACKKEPGESETVRDILAEQKYISVSLGEAYHQENVLFDLAGEKAVIPQKAEWGRPGFREKEEAGIFYGPEEGGELYDTDVETTPELYIESYMESVLALDLKVSDIKNENYVIKVAEKSKLKPFAAELVRMSNIVLKGRYKLTGVEIEFDKQCRPVRKIFQLQEIDESELKKENESSECVQEFSYEVGKKKFESELKKVRKEIEEE